MRRHLRPALAVVALFAVVCALAATAAAATTASVLSSASAFADAARGASDVGTFFQITDLHVDFQYVVGSNPHCSMPLCCRDVDPSAPEKSGPFGHPLCDTTETMLRSALEFIASSEPDFVLWTGDSPNHHIWDQNRPFVQGVLTNVTNIFAELLPNTTVIPAIGNHDTFPVDEMPPPPASDWVFNTMLDLWGRQNPWLRPSEMATFSKGGYYSRVFETGFRIVVYNSAWGDPLNFYMYINDTDPTGQLAWIRTELAAARAAGEKVLMVGHIPTGPVEGSVKPRCMTKYCEEYMEIISEYGDIVLGTLFGHTHTDYFRVVHDRKTSVPSSVLFVSPALTPYQRHNPTVRQFFYNRTTHELINIKQYYTDLVESNKNGEITWLLEYSMRSLYDLPDLKPASFDALVKRMHTDNLLFDAFYTFYESSGRGPGNLLCDSACKHRWLCVLGTAWADETIECLATKGIGLVSQVSDIEED